MAAPKRKQITCPSCQHQQMEYVEANSTFCHVCGTRISLQEKQRPQKKSRTGSRRSPLKRNKHLCLHCSHPLHIPEASDSWQCPACSGYLDLKDHELNVSAGRSILTYGDITIKSRGRFGGTRLEGSHITVQGGSIAGQITGREQVLVARPCTIDGDVKTDTFIVEREGKFENRKSLRCRTAEIAGKVRVRELVVTGSLRVVAGASLQVEVLKAPSVEVEEGGRLIASEAVLKPETVAGSAEDEPAPALS